MKKVYLFVIAFGIVAGAHAQPSPATFQWGKAEGKYAYDYGYGIQTDNQGNVYVAGKYEEDQADFSGTKISCRGNHDGFLIKYDPSGAVQWIQTMGGADGDYYWALSTDKSNYLVASGEIENTTAGGKIWFSSSTTTLQCGGDNDMVLAKYDLDGNLIWALREGGSGSEKGLANTIDPQGNIYVCGYFDGTTVFNGQSFTSAGNRDIYVAKYNSSGVFQWFRQMGSPERDEAKGVVCDAQGNVYICGMFDNNCDFLGQTLNTRQNTPYWDAFVAKLDPNGNLVWVRTGGGDVDDGAWSITMDNAGDIYIGGETAAYAEFGSHVIQAYGAADSYIAKYNPNGDCLWVKHAGSEGVDRIRGIGTDGTFIFATGQIDARNGDVGIFGSSSNTIVSVDTSDVFIAVIDKDGTWGFVNTIGGIVDLPESLGYESGNAVTGTANGEIYATGGLLQGGVFGSQTITGYTRTDAFVTKLTWGRSVGVAELPTLGTVHMYPNPAKDKLFVDLKEINSEVNVCLYNCLGEKIQTVKANGRAEIDLQMQSAGIYFIQIEAGDLRSSAQKLVIE